MKDLSKTGSQKLSDLSLTDLDTLRDICTVQLADAERKREIFSKAGERFQEQHTEWTETTTVWSTRLNAVEKELMKRIDNIQF